MPMPRPIAPLLAAAVALAASGVYATQTQFFKVDTKDAFKAGKLDGLVATGFGELRLARKLDTVLKDDGKYASIDALAEGPDGTVYVGTTASGKLIAMKDDRSTELADFGEGASVSALAVQSSGDVLVGVSGERAKLYLLKRGAEKPEELVTLDEDTQYVWGIAADNAGNAIVATGPAGKLFALDVAKKAATVLYDSDEDNLRCVALMNDTVFVGTDPHGLVLKIDRKTGKAFVVYDAPETEIGALLIDAKTGQLFAATSQLVTGAEPSDGPQQQQRGGANSSGETQPAAGRPAGGGGGGGGDLPGTAPADPKPPADAPRPGELKHEAREPQHEAGDSPEAPNGPPSSQPILPNANAATSPSGPRPQTPNANSGQEEVSANGNAVYRIDSQGFVSEIFRESNAMVFALARSGDDLLVATGPNGTLYQVNLASEEHTAVAQTRSKMLTSLLLAQDGRAWLGSSDGAELSRMSADLAKTGTFTSAVLDAQQISAFGKLQARGSVPEGTTMTLSVRSGNVSDEDSPLWGDWSEPVPAARFASVATPAARYAQIRATLTGDGKSKTPTLGSLELAYVRPNVAPRIESVAVTTPAVDGATDDEPKAQPMRQVTWTAADANGDAMRFTLSARPAGAAADEPWVAIAKDVSEANYQWDTRRVKDGRYEVKVEASDALANAPGAGKTASRVSDPIVVDNAAPTIGDVTQKRDAGKVEIGVHVVDRGGGIVAKLEYRLDDAEHWQTVTASDNLDDSPDERYAISLPDPGSQTRVVSLRARDENGNMAYESVTVRPAAK